MVKTVQNKSKQPVPRAASYCRTSGEGQRDNTSIPTQKEDNCKRIETEKWKFVRHYIDECKSGSKIAGRDAFQQMMRDAAKGEFDILVVSDINRFSRDGFDIINSVKTLSTTFGVHVVDAKGFDTRDSRRVLTNFIYAGVAQDERLRILDRTMRGRMKNAKDGKPWHKTRPVGREYDSQRCKWYVTDKGIAIRKVLERYVAGEDLTSLCKEYGFPYRQKFYYWVANSQLAGDFYAHFNQPEVGIVNQRILVPGMPEVVSLGLLD
jgi:DNA invertase Pin-like site-specific DNA recombinase